MSGKLLAVSLELSEYRNNTPGKHERLNPEPSTHPMDLEVITRAGPAALLPKRRPAILLSGLWPDADRSGVVELDEVLDRRYAWIDGEAERLAEVAARQPPGLPPPPAWVHALGLRYYLLRLLRIVVYFTAVRPLGSDDRLRLLAGRDDEDKARLVTLLCQRAGATCRVAWREEAETPIEQLGGEGKWRGLLRRLGGRLASPPPDELGPPRIILCGNPRFLDPVCRALHARGCRQWWLYDRLAIKPFLRWQWRGVGQLTCDGASGLEAETVDPPLPELAYGGIDLRPLVAGWLADRLASRGRDLIRQQRQIEAHFEQIKPAVLLVDEDATPMKRIALVAARRCGADTLVVQHGTPVARFGFAPLAADGIFAWGRSSREQLERWGVPSDRIFVTGSPAHDGLFRQLRAVGRKRRKGHRPTILLLATVPPRDSRPDLLELHLTSRTYAEMIEAAFSAAAGIEDATLLVRPHPRSAGDPVVRAAAARHPHLATKVILGGSLAKSLRGVDCVLSCVSSAGIESTVTGLPVIQLIPRGAGPILPPDRWGVFENVSTAGELARSLRRALSEAAGGARRVGGLSCAGDDRGVEGGLGCDGARDDGPGDPFYVERRDGPGDPPYGERRDGPGDPFYGAAERIAEMLIGRVISRNSANQGEWQPRRRVGKAPRQAEPPRQAIGIR